MYNQKIRTSIISVILVAVATLACGGSRVARQADLPKPQVADEATNFPETATAGWVDFTSEAGNFSARFPVTPEEQVQAAPGNEARDVYLFIADQGSAAYMISYTDFQSEATALSPEVANQTFDMARDSLVSSMAGTITAEEETPLGEHPGRQITFTIAEEIAPGGGQGVARLYMVNNRLYLVTTFSQNKAYSPEQANDFLASFALLAAPVSQIQK
jgi:hypothetical protein